VKYSARHRSFTPTSQHHSPHCRRQQPAPATAINCRRHRR